MDVSVLEPGKWELIFTLLSLDGMLPLYEAMGLRFPDKQQFLQMLRSLIIKNREIYGTEPIQDTSLASQVLQGIETSFGRPTVDHFYNWAMTVFFWTHQDQPHWSAWDIILLYDEQLTEQVNLAPEKHAAIIEFRNSTETNDVEQQIAELKSQPLSPWDLKTYSIYSFDNKEDPMHEDDFIDPYSIVLSTVGMNRFQLGWKKLMEQFSPEEKACLLSYGQQMLTKEQIEMPDSLRHPDELQRQIP